jgi:hypothetical protein
MPRSDFNWPYVPQDLIDRLPTDCMRTTARLLASGMTYSQACHEVGISTRVFYANAQRVKGKLQAMGYDPENGMTLISPDPQVLKGRTAFVRVDPNTGEERVTHYYNKTETNRQQQSLAVFADSLADSIKPAKPVKYRGPANSDHDLMSAIFIGDAHIGMYAYAPETRHSDFDSEIAAEALRAAIDNLVDRSPPAGTGMLVDVGDFMHANTSHNQTYGGTPVDVDTRFERVMEIAAGVMTYAIDKMLTKFPHVVVVVAKGNHNPDAAVAIQKILAAYYRLDDRVTVLKTQGFYHYLEWGKWLIGIHHGDKVKAQKLPGIMARDMSEAWGRTRSRMWALGHFHHQEVLELDGCTVQKFGALPPPDGWHAGMGYSSVQSMQMIVYRKEGGRESTLIYELPRPPGEPDWRVE